MKISFRPNVLLQAVLSSGLMLACGDNSDGANTEVAQTAGGADGGLAASGSKAPASNGGRGGQSGTTRAVKIHFRGMVGDRPFDCAAQYEPIGATKVTATPADFRFYLQDVKLIAADGSEVPVQLETRSPWQTPDVAMIDFEDMTNSCHGTPGLNDYVSGTVPAGEYNGVVFSNGVPESLNHLEQSKQPPPLDLTDMYWQWLTGYRFFVLELLEADPQARASAAAGDDAGVVLPGVGLLHVGSTACRKDVGCTKGNRNEIRLMNFNPDTDVIAADAATVFTQTDITQDMQCHSSGDLCEPMYQSVGVSWETGQSAADLQQIYRVLPDQVMGNN